MAKRNIEIETPAFTVGHTGDTYVSYYIKPNTATGFKCFLDANAPEDIIRNLRDGTAGEGMFVDIGKATVSVRCSGWTTFPKTDVIAAFERLNAKVTEANTPPFAKLPPGAYYAPAYGGGKVFTQSEYVESSAKAVGSSAVWSYDPTTNTTLRYWVRDKESGWYDSDKSRIDSMNQCEYTPGTILLIIPDPKEN